MGSKIYAKIGDPADLVISFHSPATNNAGARPTVDHVDVISGDVHGRATRGSAAYANAGEPTARVVARIDVSRLTARADGSYVVTVPVGDPGAGKYFRLRGTNLAVGTKNQVDAHGDPIIDTASGRSSAAKAWTDLWFYTNPVWILPETALAASIRRLR
jgi:hypothetical protein